MVEIIQEQPKSSVYGAQPRSLNINWMKYDVTDENLKPEDCRSAPKRLLPIQQKLQ